MFFFSCARVCDPPPWAQIMKIWRTEGPLFNRCARNVEIPWPYENHIFFVAPVFGLHRVLNPRHALIDGPFLVHENLFFANPATPTDMHFRADRPDRPAFTGGQT